MNKNSVRTCGIVLSATLLAGLVAVHAAEKKDMSTKIAESTVTTNDNGSVSRVFVESSITTNGNLVTEHRRETRTSMDSDGNVLGTTTSEYAQSYNVGDTGWKLNTKLGADVEKPVIAAWIFTHLHGDHIGVFNCFSLAHHDDVVLERLYYNFPKDAETAASDSP